MENVSYVREELLGCQGRGGGRVQNRSNLILLASSKKNKVEAGWLEVDRNKNHHDTCSGDEPKREALSSSRGCVRVTYQ